MSDRLPQESRSQEIGQKAEVGLTGSRPLHWRVHSVEGPDDVGLDFQVQVLGEQRFRNIFRLQLKGTESPDFSASGDFFSVTLKSSTLNFYDRITEPVMLVLCDLSQDAEPSKCSCYYTWVHDEIRRLKSEGTFDTEAATRTIRIPKANLVSRALDVNQVLEDHLRLHSAANAFDQAVASAIPEFGPDQRTQVLGGLATAIPGRGRGYVESLSDPGPAPWPQAPKESIAGRLNAVDQYLKVGDTVSAERVLGEVQPSIDTAASLERAEFWYLTGRSRSLCSREKEAIEAYECAHRIEPATGKYVVALVEAQLRLRYVVGRPCDISDLMARLKSDKPEVVGLAARLLAASGRFPEAEAKLNELPRSKTLNERAIIATMRGDSEAAIALCDEGLSDTYINDHSRQLFHLLRARAFFNRALDLKPDAKEDYIIPVFGPPSINIGDLHKAWNDIERTVDLMRLAGWPLNVEFLSDIWVSTALVLGRQEDALPDVLEAARRRPLLPGLQSCLEKIAVQCGKFDLVVEAVDRQPDGPEKIFRKIAALHQAKQNSACVELMRLHRRDLPRSHDLFPISLTLALLSAEQLVREEDVREFDVELKSNPEWADHAAIADYFRAIGQNVLAKDEALSKLERAYENTNHSINIGIQLFHALDVNKDSQAIKCIAIAPALMSHGQLGIDSMLHLAQAYVTINEWPRLLSLTEGAMTRFGPIGRLIAVRAFALDKSGRTPEAMDELKTLVSSGARDQFAINTYINIVTRCGFTDEAIALVEEMISRESKRDKTLAYLRLLFGLVHRSDPQGQRSESIAWRIGQMSKQNDEAEEGLFLITYLTATLSEKVTVPQERTLAFQQRLSAFLKTFPKSKILRGATLPENPTVRDLEKMIEEVTGDNSERRAHQAKMFAELERGIAPIPFAWRPRNVLSNVGDIPALWEIAKTSRKDANAYHLAMALGNWQCADPRDLSGQIPILDLLTLFVIKDLKLFDVVFALFPRIAVGQATLLELQRLAQPMAGSWALDRCAEVIEELKKRFDRIVQPAIPKSDDWHLDEKQTFEEVKDLVSSGQFLLYSDDALFRMYAAVPADAPQPICTLDVLNAADVRGLLSPKEVAHRISLLCRWNVGVVVTQRNLISAIPDDPRMTRSLESAIELLQGDEIASPIFEGIWNVRKTYLELFNHAASLISTLIKERGNRVEAVAAIWAVWYLKAKLRVDASLTPPLRHMAYSMCKAAQEIEQVDNAALGRLWGAFMAIVAMEFGDRMEVRHERESVQLVGHVAAEVEAKAPVSSSVKAIEPILKRGLTEGTAPFGWFTRAYSDRRIELAKATKENRGT